jgi:glycine dehydrogenase subunit 1
MRYFPHTDAEVSAMLEAVGIADLAGLFAHIPDECRFAGDIEVPGPLTEWDLTRRLEGLGQSMAVGHARAVLLGAGSYHHYIPEAVKSVMGRAEFLTSYTPYQPEVSQGTLQGIFEFQTLIARLLGVQVANASMYDGGSALAEALLMALRIKRKKTTVAISKAIHPHYRQVIKTYLAPSSFTIVELPVDASGRTDLSGLETIDECAAVALQSPNFFGVIEDLEQAATAIHDRDALFVACFSEPLAYGLLRSPGSLGADIVCGEGQSFGIAQSFGGAGLGLFGCRSEFIRNMPGRVVGETVDMDGKRGFVLTLSTREQHIRREKATSNICSNQGICALTAAAYLAALGGSGLRQLAKLNYDKAAYLKNGLREAGGKLLFEAPHFNEFVMRFDFDFTSVRANLMDKGVIIGLDCTRFYPEYEGAFLFCATETVSRELMDECINEVRQ